MMKKRSTSHPESRTTTHYNHDFFQNWKTAKYEAKFSYENCADTNNSSRMNKD
jgi:hypothetical protein